MKFNKETLILLGILVACLACSCVKSSDSEGLVTQADVIETKTRNGLSIPKLFDFDRYKNVFKKRYNSVMEELARKRIFLGRAIRAFVSFISYKHYQINSYLKINELSDWTIQEFKKILNKPALSGKKVKVIEEEDDLQKTPVADMKDIEEKLDEISKHPEFGSELKNNNNNNNRRKRDASVEGQNERSSLTVDDLFAEPKVKLDESEHIPSNNPHYQTPELSSYGAEDDQQQQTPMEEETTSIIAGLPGAKFVASLFSNLFGASSPPTTHSAALGGSYYEHAFPRSKEPDQVFVDHRDSGCFQQATNQGRW